MNCPFAPVCDYQAPDQTSLDAHTAYMLSMGDPIHGGVTQPLNENQLAEEVISEPYTGGPKVLEAAENPPVTPADPQPDN